MPVSTRGLILWAVGATIALFAVSPASAESAAPSCAEGPTTVRGTILGTPCDDTIVAPSGVSAVEGGGGDDTIVPAPISASAPCPAGCFLGIGSQTFEGGPGDDIVYGERGNDRLLGGEGNDQLFGGIGDDLLEGGPGNDRLSGGFGADSVSGGPGDDYVRGDGTADPLLSGGEGSDTLSYSTGIAPGFFDGHSIDPSAANGLPPEGGERGVYLNLATSVADNGVAPFGGGVDKTVATDFETVIGTPFTDYIVGSGSDEKIYGGGGGDVISGQGGNDALYGGAAGDHLDGGGGSNTIDGGSGNDHCANPTGGTSCESGANTGGVVGRDTSKVSVGLMTPADQPYGELYLSGSETADEITATYTSGSPASVSFALGAGATAPFDTSSAAAAGCNPPSGSQVTCPISGTLDSIVLAGFGGDDHLRVDGFPASVGVVMTGGEGDDSLTGESGEEVLVDGPDASGPGDDVLEGFAGDDALLNNGGEDHLLGGDGNDLLLSNSICDGDTIDGGAQRDNASWSKLKGSGVGARLDTGVAGAAGPGGVPTCSGGNLDSLAGIEDLEGSEQGDAFYGDAGDNQLLGWAGEDTYFSGAGEDRILANAGDKDGTIDCGADADIAIIDFPQNGPDVAAPNCERVQENEPNSFRIATELELPAGSESPVPIVELPPPGPPSRPRPPKEPRRPSVACLAASTVARLHCAVRPRRLGFGALGRVEGIGWRHWGARRTIGFGRLTILEGHRRPASQVPAKLRVGQPVSCESHRWYRRITVTYGPHYRRAFVRGVLSATPCD